MDLRPVAAVIDVGLPGMSGYEVASRLRGGHAEGRPCLIAITGFGEPEDRVHSYEVGIDLYLIKPVAINELELLLKRLQTMLALGR